MTPTLPHAGQLTGSPSSAIGAPLIDIKDDADVTMPSAVVEAPKVM
jgi:hypothetical protein